MANDTISLIRSGRILLFRLYDVANEIDLIKVEEILQKEAKRIAIKRKRFGKAFEFANPPVSFQLKSIDIALDGTPFVANTYSKAYEYGVLSIILEVTLSDLSIESLRSIAMSLEDDDNVDEICTKELESVISILDKSIIDPHAVTFHEDYTIFYIESLGEGKTKEDLLSNDSAASILLPEDQPLSAKTVEELMSYSFSYFDSDCVILNFDNALVIEPSGSMEIPDFLEFANSQLLELRYYDDIVDKELDTLYDIISSKGALSIWKLRKYERIASRTMKMVTELIDVTEKIDSSLKVTEDVYYAKIYMAALRMFRVREWEQGIRKKLQTAASINDMLFREIANKRTELLEFIIVVLIVIEIVIFFLLEM